MKKLRNVILLLLISLLGIGTLAMAQRPYRVSDREVDNLLTRIDNRTDAFRRSLQTALDRSRYDNTQREDNINNYVNDFATATARLRDRYNNRRSVAADVEEVLNRGMAIDNLMRNNRFAGAQREWSDLRADLRTLANYYNVTWRWDNRNDSYSNSRDDNYGYSRNNDYNRNSRYSNRSNRFTGTYQLDMTRSDNADAIISRATVGLSSDEAGRVRNALERRMIAPERIAIDQSNRQFTLISTTAPQVTFVADGQAQSETRPSGRTVRTTTSLNGNSLVVSSTGDRGSDFTVTFEPIDNGNALRVTRELYTDRLSRPVRVQSIYTRTSEIADMNIFEGRPDNGSIGANRNYDRNVPFSVPNNTRLTAVLDTNLSTRDMHPGDRFQLTVRSPREYDGAVIEGTIQQSASSGRISGRAEMVFDFQQIRMPNGDVRNFAGYIEQVTTPNGDRMKVDNEGSVKDASKQTTKTTTRAGIGAAIGAILGGVIGGGKGAVLGAVLGGGAGAGTVILEGRDDLNLPTGTEFVITAVTPPNDSSSR